MKPAPSEWSLALFKEKVRQELAVLGITDAHIITEGNYAIFCGKAEGSSLVGYASRLNNTFFIGFDLDQAPNRLLREIRARFPLTADATT